MRFPIPWILAVILAARPGLAEDEQAPIGNQSLNGVTSITASTPTGKRAPQLESYTGSYLNPIALETTPEKLRAALGDLLNAPEKNLCDRITDKGNIDKINPDMRDACYRFALLYHYTKEKSYAEKAAALLARFGKKIPKWPVYDRFTGTPYSQNEKGGEEAWDSRTGLWTWYYLDMEGGGGAPLAWAYDLIYSSGVLQARGTLNSVEQMLRRHVELSFRIGLSSQNLAGNQMRGIIAFARILKEPAWIPPCLTQIFNIYRTTFYADGWWHEGSMSYHNQTHGNLCGCISLTEGADSGSQDVRDLLKKLARPLARANGIKSRMADPNGLEIATHDTCWPEKVSDKGMEEARPELFGCMGHAILGTGRDKNMAQVSLHFGGTHGHAHYDCLNLGLFAKGRELISETKYRPSDTGSEATNTTREWHAMTAGHVTVVVDERNQLGRGRPNPDNLVRRIRQPEDAVPGIPDWPFRWSGHGDSMNDGKLRLFETGFDSVQVVEADGWKSYLPLMDEYRRLVSMVKINETDLYVLDVFRVKGGKTHDYMLHSCLDQPHRADISVPLSPRTGRLHKYIGTVLGMKPDEEKPVPENGFAIIPNGLRSGKTDAAWSVDFTLADRSAALKSYFLPQTNTEIICGEGPAMRRPGAAPFIAARQTDGNSLFAAVHHPYVGTPVIRKVETVAVTPSGGKAVGCRVTLPDRIDTIFSTTDDQPYIKRTSSDGTISFCGRFIHMAEGGPGNRWYCLVDGSELIAQEVHIKGPTGYSGVLTKTYRVEAGASFDAFETTTELPADGSLDGQTLMVDIGGALAQSFRIRSVERKEGKTLIYSLDEPGMTITPGLVKLEYFPCWGVKGKAAFRIAGSARLWQDTGGAWHFASTGPTATATVSGRTIKKEQFTARAQ